MSASLVSYYRAMARNNAWSNHRLVSACGMLTAAEYAAARTSFFPSLALTLSHIVAVERAGRALSRRAAERREGIAARHLHRSASIT